MDWLNHYFALQWNMEMAKVAGERPCIRLLGEHSKYTAKRLAGSRKRDRDIVFFFHCENVYQNLDNSHETNKKV